MKKLLLFILFCSLIPTATFAQLKFEISGTVVNSVDSTSSIRLQDEDVVLLVFTNIDRTDTAHIVNNKFIFKSEVPYPSMAFVQTEFGGERILLDNSIYTFVFEQKESLDKTLWTYAARVETESDFHNTLNNFQNIRAAKVNAKKEAINRLKTITDSDSIAYYQDIIDEVSRYYWSFANECPNKYVVAYVSGAAPDFSPEKYGVIYDNLPDSVKNTFYGELMRNKLLKTGGAGDTKQSVSVEKDEKIVVGTDVIDIACVDTAMNKVLLNKDFYKQHKYTVIDFWASWCSPCRDINVKYKKMYATLKENNIEIVGFSLDNGARRWKEAVVDDDTKWVNVSDLAGNNSPLAKYYQINAIPTNLIVDSSGKIVARDLSPEQLLELAKGAK